MGDHEIVDWIEDFFNEGFRELLLNTSLLASSQQFLGHSFGCLRSDWPATDTVKIVADLGMSNLLPRQLAMWNLRSRAYRNGVNSIMRWY